MALNIYEITDGDNNFLDLLGQLTGRCKNKSLAGLDVRVEFLEDGD
jgi:hypothetical protein